MLKLAGIDCYIILKSVFGVAVLEKAGIDLGKPMTTMCYNGHAACLMALAASVIGKEDVAVYYVS